MSAIVRKRLETILRGGRVQRFHTVPTIADHNVGHHSFGVAWIAILLCRFDASASLLAAALAHDLAEWHTGDVPAPTKRAVPELKAELDALERRTIAEAGLLLPPLTDAEQRTLRMADAMDGMLNCIHERRLGNRGIRNVYWRFRSYVEELKPEGVEQAVVRELVEMWMEADK